MNKAMREASESRTATDTDSCAFHFFHITADEGTTEALRNLMAETFIAWLLNNQDIFQKVPCPDDYAFLHSGCYRRIAGKKKYEQKSSDCDLYVSVSYGKRKIYLKYHAAPANKDEVFLTYSNFARLGTNGREDIPVVIKKSNSFWYSWRNGNSATRLNFRVAVISSIAGFISLILAIIALFD